MNIEEFKQVKNMSYKRYCKYLQDKYGIGLDDYFTPGFSPKKTCKRTSEGLFVHHIKEDKAIRLSDVGYAKEYPFEWQKKENLVYCDYLEHLFLHVLICKIPYNQSGDEVGIGGILKYLVPKLNDIYSGWRPHQDWEQPCVDRVVNDKEVYLMILKKFINWYKSEDNNCQYNLKVLHTSLSKNNNSSLYNEIDALWGNIDKYILVKNDWHNYLNLNPNERTKSVTLAAISRTWSKNTIQGFPYSSSQNENGKPIMENDDVIRSFIEAMPISVRTNKDVVEKLEYYLTMGQFFRCYPKELLTSKLIEEIIYRFSSSNCDWDLPEDIITLDLWRAIYKEGRFYNGLIRRTYDFPDKIHQLFKAEKEATRKTQNTN